jgi:AraC-like DNA-binding protein
MEKDAVMVPVFAPAFLASIGIDFSSLVAEAGARLESDGEGRHWVSTDAYFALWNAIQRLGVPADFGLRLGSMKRIEGHYDVASIAALHSQTFGDAINAIARYKQMVCPGRWLLDIQGETAWLHFRWLLAGDQAVPDFLTDGGFAYVADLYRRGTGVALKLRRIELSRRPAAEGMLSAAFGCAIDFNAPQDRMQFDASALHHTFRSHNSELLALMTPGLEAALQAHVGSPDLVTQTRQAIHAQLKGQRPSLERVAMAIGLGPRSLQRRLEDAGTSYQEQLDEVRRQSACRLLSKTELQQGEIAFYLGFEEVNSFTRAFRAWEGLSPVQWRQAQHAKSSSDLPRSVARSAFD